MKSQPVTYCVISHTHWDREWYMPLEYMKIRLVSLFDNLLKILDTQPDYIFHMDAQTVVLEDYLEIRPGQREKIRRYVQEGRLLVGPWYVQNDFYLSSGEATVRNLLIGTEQARDFGKCGNTGYCPDQFGNIPQLPQIFAGFGIGSCVFGRGRNRKPQPVQEFYWQSENGSRVFCSYLTYWYNTAQRFSPNLDRSEKMLEFIRKNSEKSSAGTQYLLMNGVDHLEAQDDLLPILKALQQRLPEGDRIYQGTLDGYMEALEASLKNTPLETDIGEMRDGDKANVLAGTLSSRIYLKAWNDRCQMLLERQLEPLYSLLADRGVQEYPGDYMRYLWRQLLQNLAHDSICGCSVDAVNRHMGDRYACIEEGASRMLSQGMETLQTYLAREAVPEDAYLLTVLNPVQTTRTVVTEVQVDILEKEDLGAITLQDAGGNCPQFQVLSRALKARGIVSPINLPGVINVWSYRVRLFAEDIPGMGYRTYFARPSAGQTLLPEALPEAPPVLENRFLRAQVNKDGTVDLTEKASGRTYKGLLAAEDTADLGDSYIFEPEPGFHAVSSQAGTAAVCWAQNDGLSQQLEVTVEMALPQAYDAERKKRTDKTVPCILRLLLRLDKDSPMLGVKLQFENQAGDHRLRLRFPTGTGTDYSYSGNPFDCICRDRRTAHSGPEIFDQPFSEFTAVEEAGAGIALFGKGLHEYEHAMDGALYLTVLRATEYITRDLSQSDLVEDGWRVPENQCLGSQSVELAVYPYAGDHISAQAAGQALCFSTPVLTGFQPKDPKKFSGGRPFVQGTDTPEFFFVPKAFPDKTLPLADRFFAVKGHGVVLSACKLAEQGNALVLRLYHTGSEPAQGELCFTNPPAAVYAASLAEAQGDLLPSEKGRVLLAFAPKEIRTLLVRL